MTPPSRPAALLALADGTLFEGEAAGSWGPRRQAAAGEVVFNTAMTGYQEVLTDPSYAGQLICFTYPHIGNYGVCPSDDESRRPFCAGVIVRELPPRPSSWRSAGSLEQMLVDRGVSALVGVDTRRLTRHIRNFGAMPAAFAPTEGPWALGEAEILAAAKAAPPTDGQDLASEVTTDAPYTHGQGPLRVVAYDFGIKRAILEQLGAWASVEVVPATTTAKEALALEPDGVFLSNGPGDPAAVGYAKATIGELLGRVPIFGICLGHQLLGSALGASTYKLAFGHHGANHPVRRLGASRVEITSQNHNYALADDLPSGVRVTHVNLNDGVIEGIDCPSLRAFGVQYHPEAGPGPHDARYLFDRFAAAMRGEG